ncbi:MAG TPA: glycosyltransferase family 39 protein [Phycisphaerae bacterium]|nr:glycosyltransferase family 39 protein [Phycisphaerae bacterium]HRW54381.1 glycosyltransferase family 39 protein [Phycisphaerae bacterium]
MTSPQPRTPAWAFAILALCVCGGGALRLWNLGLHSLWLDEAWLANTLISDSLRDVVFRGPGAAAPNSTPFLLSLSIHYLTRLLDDSEFTLRLIPALFSTASIVTIWLLARQLGASTFTALFAAILIAFNPVSIEYAKELKQYAGDTFWIPLLLVCACRFADKPTWRSATLLSLGTVIAFGFAQTIALALPGACVYLAIRGLGAMRSNTPEVRRPLPIRSAFVVAIWLVGIAAIYLTVLRYQSSERLVAFWDEFFPTSASPDFLARYAGGHIVGFCKWFFGGYLEVVPDALRPDGDRAIIWTYVVLAVAIVGAIRLAVTRPIQLLTMVLAPGAVALAMSTRRMFPFGAVRVNLFMLPFVILLVAFSADAIAAAMRRAASKPANPTGLRRAMAVLTPVSLIGLAIALANPRVEKELHDPKRREELRPLIDAMLKDYRENDVVIQLDNHTAHAYHYYTRRRAIDFDTFKTRWSDSVLLKSFENASAGHRRVWIPMSHFHRGRIEEILGLLAKRWPNLAVIDRRDAVLAFFDAGSRPERIPPTAFEVRFPNGDDRAALATDGDPTTHWMSSSPREPGWQITIELSSPQRLSAVVLNTPIWPDDWSHELHAQWQGDDETGWSSEGLSVWEGPRTTIRFEGGSEPVRRIRLINLQRDPKFHWSIHELEVWAQPGATKNATN